MKREDEESARLEFDSFLRQRLGCEDLRWQDVPQKEEPPDYYLNLAGERFAVEVTGLVMRVNVDRGPTEELGIQESSRRLVQKIEDAALKRGSLSGAYLVTACPLPDLSKRSTQLEREILEFVESTRDIPNTRTHLLGQLASGSWTIIKKHDQDNHLHFAYERGCAEWRLELVQELRTLLDDAIQVKEKKLARVGDPVVLLLLDRFFRADASIFREAASGLTSRTRFHTIFRAAPGFESFVITTDEPKWR